MKKILSLKKILKLSRYWPPFLGAGITVTAVSDDYKYLRTEMVLRPWNSNYVGCHYGGSLFSMTDPFYMLMFLHFLGKDYIVWDQAAEIVYKKPGKGRVYAEFRITDDDINEIKQTLETQTKLIKDFQVSVLDESGDIVSQVRRSLYFRKKRRG